MHGIDHERFMRRAIELAANAPDLPFGAVIVQRGNGTIVAEGWNRWPLSPILHGEIDALMTLYHGGLVPGAELVLYTTAEPCPMCMGAILWAGIGGVVFGTSIRSLQQSGWAQIDIRAEEVLRRSPGMKCDLIGGVLERECNALFAKGPPGGLGSLPGNDG